MTQRKVALVDLITDAAAMSEVLTSGRVSDTPDDPIWVNTRAGAPGKWEIADGHHRVADAIRAGRTHVPALFDPEPDEEPYEGPLFDFAAALSHC